MAKRRRLTPPNITYLEPDTEGTAPRAPETKSLSPSYPLGVAPKPPARAPIADVAGDASTAAALAEVSAELSNARSEGRLIQALTLDKIDPAHLVRDRINVDAAEMQSLMESIRTRGQQTPIEVVELENRRYGLISGWRRYQALTKLSESESGDGFARIQALIRAPKDLSQAYVSMVEENEIRVGLSYFERAHIVQQTVASGIYSDAAAALADLFASASRAKRSKIKSFLPVVAALGTHLRYPTALTERAGLSLAQKITQGDKEFLTRLKDRLRHGEPKTPEQELALIGRALSGQSEKPATSERRGIEVAPGVFAKEVGQGVQITGLDEARRGIVTRKLREWLAE